VRLRAVAQCRWLVAQCRWLVAQCRWLVAQCRWLVASVFFFNKNRASLSSHPSRWRIVPRQPKVRSSSLPKINYPILGELFFGAIKLSFFSAPKVESFPILSGWWEAPTVAPHFCPKRGLRPRFGQKVRCNDRSRTDSGFFK
jgi:hypothetical protein